MTSDSERDLRLTAGCVQAVMSNLAAVLTGGLGGLLVILASRLLVTCRVDDPVSASAVHGVGGLWSMLAVGLAARKDNLEGYVAYDGLLHGGGFYLLGVQALACLCCVVWAVFTTAIIIFLLTFCIRLRSAKEGETEQ